jgi:hypothetical protein
VSSLELVVLSALGYESLREGMKQALFLLAKDSVEAILASPQK